MSPLIECVVFLTVTLIAFAFIMALRDALAWMFEDRDDPFDDDL